MATTYRPVNRSRHCPVCDGDHKCSVGQDGSIMCGRKTGDQPGFVFYGKAEKDPQFSIYRAEDHPHVREREEQFRRERCRANGKVAKRESPPQPTVDWAALARQVQANLTPERSQELASALNLPERALAELEVGWLPEGECWTFPERDGRGNVCGILRRFRDGRKMAMPGGKRGLIIPPGWRDRDGPLFLVEGPSDAAALTAMGQPVIGRPSNRGGVDELAELLADLPPDREVIVLGEIDANDKGQWPGREGMEETAARLQSRLKRPVAMALPPGKKDVRDWSQAQGLDATTVQDAWEEAGSRLLGDLNTRKRFSDPGEATATSTPPIGGNTGTGHGDALTLIPCSELKATPEERKFIWHGFLAWATVTLFSALMKAGKTTLLAHLLRALEKGGDFLGLAARACKILYITEEHESRWADRRDALSLADHVTFIVRPFRAKPTVQEWTAFLRQLREAQEKHGFDLIVFDTLSNLWPVKDENSATEVQAALMPLHTAIGEAGLVLVHHLKKGDGGEGTGSRGSSALLAWVDIILEQRRYTPHDHKDRRRVLTGYGRFEQTPPELVINLDEKGGYSAEGSSRAEVQAKDTADILEEVIPPGEKGRTVKEIIEAWPGDTEPNRTRLYAALKKGLAEGRWERTGEGKNKDPYRYHQTSTSTGPLEGGTGTDQGADERSDR